MTSPGPPLSAAGRIGSGASHRIVHGRRQAAALTTRQGAGCGSQGHGLGHGLPLLCSAPQLPGMMT